MLRGNKGEAEVRFELFTWGAMLIMAAIMWVLLRNVLPGAIVFFPGLILLGSAIFQDMQSDWRAGWVTYLMAIVMVATGLTGIVNTIFTITAQTNRIYWLVIAVVELGAVLIVKAVYDPTPRS